MRDSYGAGEQAAHDIMRAAAETIGLEVAVDAIGNLTMTLPGRDRSVPRILIGSHLDSVPQGGNFDGAAGVVAGLCALSALQQGGCRPPWDISVMGIRAEESAWFDVAYIGSAGAFGLLDPACLSMPRSDNGQSLEATLIERGFDPAAIRERRRLLEPSQIRAYLELHIEQGPTLAASGLPAAVVTGIRGCKRFRNARCLGEYAHSGAVYRPYRHDAVAATVALLHHLEAVWLQQEEAGADLVITSGEFFTDPPCTVRARSPARRASSSTCAASPKPRWTLSRPRRGRRPRASAGLPRRLRSGCHQRFASRGDGRAAACQH